MKNIIKTINTQNLNHNLKFLSSKIKNFCAVLKADAYGHGIKNVIKQIEPHAKFFAVNTTNEARQILKHTKKPILLLKNFEKSDLNFVSENNIRISIFDKKQLLNISNYATKHKKTFILHLKLDTGMNRLGIKNCLDFCDAKQIINSSKYLKLEGVFTHFGGGNNKRFLTQQNKFFKFLGHLKENILVHSKSSSYALKTPLQENEMARIGLLIYGYGNKNLKPIMEIKAKVIFVSTIQKGEFVGYGNAFKAKRETRYAVISIGYADGLPRNYKNGYVLLNGKKAKILGNICMNMTIISLEHTNAKIGDYAYILCEKLSAEVIAKKCKTIPYEILTNFSKV